MVLDVMGLGRSYLSESSLEPELQNDDLDSIDSIDESVMTCDEFMLALAYQCEANMHAIDMAIAGTEYMALRETGQEMVWEGFSIKGIIDKAKQGVQWLWGQIQKFFKTVIDKFNSWRIDNFLKKYQKDAEGKTVSIKTKLVLTTKFGSTDFDMMTLGKLLDTWDPFSDLASEANRVVSSYQVLADKPESGKGVEDVDKELKDIASAVFMDIKAKDGKDFDDAGEAIKALMDSLGIKGTSNEATDVKINAGSACAFLKTFVKDKRKIKDAYEKNKKKINEDLKNLKKFESTLKTHKVFSNDASKAVHNGVKVIQKTGKWLTMCNRALIKAMNTYCGLARKAVVAAASLKTAKDESAAVGNTLFNSIDFVDIV